MTKESPNYQPFSYDYPTYLISLNHFLSSFVSCSIRIEKRTLLRLRLMGPGIDNFIKIGQLKKIYYIVHNKLYSLF